MFSLAPTKRSRLHPSPLPPWSAPSPCRAATLAPTSHPSPTRPSPWSPAQSPPKGPPAATATPLLLRPAVSLVTQPILATFTAVFTIHLSKLAIREGKTAGSDRPTPAGASGRMLKRKLSICLNLPQPLRPPHDLAQPIPLKVICLVNDQPGTKCPRPPLRRPKDPPHANRLVL